MDATHLNALANNPDEPLPAICSRLDPHQQSTLFNICSQLDPEKQGVLLHAVLHDRIGTALLPWLRNDCLPYELYIKTPSGLAFDQLTRQRSNWLNEPVRLRFFEKEFAEALLTNNNDLLSKFKALIERSRSGLSAGFLERMVQQYAERLTLQQEIDLYLLIAKLEEGNEQMHPALWDERLRVILPQKPYLYTILLYINRETEPVKAMRYLADWQSNNATAPEESIRGYLVAYLRHALIALDGGGNPYEYWYIRAWLQRNGWFSELLEEVLADEAMLEIARHIEEPNSYIRIDFELSPN